MSKNGSAYHRMLNTSRWRRLRLWQLDHYPFCADCCRKGVMEVATDVHHVVPVESEPVRDRMAMRCYDKSNLVSLCHTCHVERHRAMRSHSATERQRRVDESVKAFWDSVSGASVPTTSTDGGSVFEATPTPVKSSPQYSFTRAKNRDPFFGL